MSDWIPDHLPDDVRDGKLETRFLGKQQIIHFVDNPNAPPSSVKIEEHWQRDKQPLAHGGQARVFLQTCTAGPQCGTKRVVKSIRIQSGSTIKRLIVELRTLRKFSHDKASHLS